ncbi:MULTISPECIES: Cof-type HAD-IIB family hydrolase [unclassified Salinivibrio]|nr:MULTISPECIES: Cof-type HAD-IIB family hydrolase [unclassified Salinivibrio]ODP97801.1 sugar/pyridoxal phosphate phosphatase YigL [Salinivibrio sp. DV]OOF29172.1 sugar/pyridoxal phosphate phosphatase YigL [Salinivibrio sp. IB872]
MYKLVASDLDGTLLTPEHRIAPYTKQVLQQLHQQGIHFVFATGRHHVDVASIRETVGIPAYMITSNGARVHDSNDQLVYQHNVDPAIVANLINEVKHDPTVTIHLYRDNDWLLSKMDEELARYHQDSGFNAKEFDVENPPVDNIAKIFFIRHDHDHLLKYEHQFLSQYGDNISIAFSTPFCLEVMGNGVSKGAALEEVARRHQLNLADCIAFGDGMNDVEMLRAAGRGLVMATAQARVKATLSDNAIIGSHADEAVARYLNAHLLAPQS